MWMDTQKATQGISGAKAAGVSTSVQAARTTVNNDLHELWMKGNPATLPPRHSYLLPFPRTLLPFSPSLSLSVSFSSLPSHNFQRKHKLIPRGNKTTNNDNMRSEAGTWYFAIHKKVIGVSIKGYVHAEIIINKTNTTRREREREIPRLRDHLEGAEWMGNVHLTDRLHFLVAWKRWMKQTKPNRKIYRKRRSSVVIFLPCLLYYFVVWNSKPFSWTPPSPCCRYVCLVSSPCPVLPVLGLTW